MYTEKVGHYPYPTPLIAGTQWNAAPLSTPTTFAADAGNGRYASKDSSAAIPFAPIERVQVTLS